MAVDVEGMCSLPAFKCPDYKIDRAAVAIGAALGRTRAGVSVKQAQAEMSGIAARMADAYPATNKERGAFVQLKEVLAENIRPAITGLAFAVAFVLLIGCANVAGVVRVAHDCTRSMNGEFVSR